MVIVPLALLTALLLVGTPVSLYVGSWVLRVKHLPRGRLLAAAGVVWLISLASLAVYLFAVLYAGLGAGPTRTLAVLGVELVVITLLLAKLLHVSRLRSFGVFVISQLLMLGVTLIVRATAVEAFAVSAGSMAPTLIPGDRILADKLTIRWRQPGRGDVIVLHPPHQPQTTYIKRVIGVGGDQLELREGELLVNGVAAGPCQPVDPRMSPDWPGGVRFPACVPEGHLFVMGDNRLRSLDSRFWGYVPCEAVVGYVTIIYASATPPASDAYPPRATVPDPSPGAQPVEPVRWERIGRVVR